MQTAGVIVALIIIIVSVLIVRDKSAAHQRAAPVAHAAIDHTYILRRLILLGIAVYLVYELWDWR